jgi:hypothetical protein
MMHKHYYCNIEFRAESMNTIVGNLERKLAAYAEEQQEEQPQYNPIEEIQRGAAREQAQEVQVT